MKSRVVLCVGITAMGILSSVSHAQVYVGAEDFESYSVGSWDTNSAPSANPLLSGGGAGANITNSGTAGGQELWVDLNLTNQYGGGIAFNLDMTGNVSRDIHDYELDLYLRVDPSTWSSLTNSGIGLTIYNPNDAAQGTEVSLSGAADYGYAVTNGAVLSIPLTGSSGLTYIPWDKDEHVDASIPALRMSFTSGLKGALGQVDQPITFVLDDLVLRYVAPPMINPTGAPTGYQPTNSFSITGTVLDGANEVEAMELHIDSSIVATNNGYAGGSATNEITYDAADLGAGFHSAKIKALDSTGTNTLWYTWTFYVAGDPEAPASEIVGLYNINFANSSADKSYGVFSVDNGTAAAAPSLGSNNWYNVDYPNIFWLGGVRPMIGEASGDGVFGDIQYEGVFDGLKTYGPTIWDGLGQSWADANSNTVWAAALGGADCNMNFELRGLPEDVTYDLYLYFTHPKNADTATNTYTLITGYAPSMSARLLTQQAAVSGGVQNTNYVTITEISPVEGTIRFNAAGGSNGGGLSALQLAVRRPDVSVIPSVQSIAVSANGFDLTWESQKYIDYRILGKSDLVNDETWHLVTNGIPGAGSSTTISVPESAGTEFFKVEAY